MRHAHRLRRGIFLCFDAGTNFPGTIRCKTGNPLASILILVGISLIPSAVAAAELLPVERLGKQIFFDKNLSTPAGQSCASCHAPETGFTGPDSVVNQQTGVYPGASPGRFGNRKPPSAAYASFSPKRHFVEEDGTWVGGQFWDGRVDDLIEQAKGPFLNPLEMANSSSSAVVDQIRRASYRAQFEQVFGTGALDPSQSEAAFDQIAIAIAAYEASSEVNAFSSKYDAYLNQRAKLTPREQRGLKLFAGKANCSACHPHERAPDGTPPLFTDFTYDNVGAPRNPSNPFYNAGTSINADGRRYRDLGLGTVVRSDSHAGKVKVPTLRNVAKKPGPGFVKAYFHNGSFKSLKEVVHFYNLAGVTPDKFAPPDVPENVNREELGHLGLTDQDEDDLVAFLETLSDAPVRDESAPSDQEPGNLLNFRQSTASIRDLIRVEIFKRRNAQASKSNLNSIR